jgi:hypothetical protein
VTMAFFTQSTAVRQPIQQCLELANKGGADHAVPLGCRHYGVDRNLWPCVRSPARTPFREATTNCRRLRQAAELPPSRAGERFS